MPELPEVEVTKRGLANKLLNRKIVKVLIHNKKLRFPIPDEIVEMEQSTVLQLSRRSKYIFIETEKGTAILHLGMTGHLRVDDCTAPLKKHDHYEFILDNNEVLRYNDPRRFGALLWTSGDPNLLPIISMLGVEPLTNEFTASYLLEKLIKRKISIKQALMDNKVVVGVGNIYANEVLFACRIDPQREACTITHIESEKLVGQIKETLANSILQGGTTIRDYAQVDGKPGYFVQNLKIYGRNGQKCVECGNKVMSIRQGQRSTFYCPYCQK